MYNRLIILVALILGNFAFSQKYSTKTGTVHFEANVPLFEDVDAKNSSVATVLNIKTGDIASIAMNKNFKFKSALMEEHFNENYAESSKYPKAVFVGKIENYNLEELNTSPRSYTVSGSLTFHGVKNNVSSTAQIYRKDDKIYISGKFSAKPAEYNISIPSVIKKKIAETVNVDYNFELEKI